MSIAWGAMRWWKTKIIKIQFQSRFFFGFNVTFGSTEGDLIRENSLWQTKCGWIAYRDENLHLIIVRLWEIFTNHAKTRVSRMCVTLNLIVAVKEWKLRCTSVCGENFRSGIFPRTQGGGGVARVIILSSNFHRSFQRK